MHEAGPEATVIPKDRSAFVAGCGGRSNLEVQRFTMWTPMSLSESATLKEQLGLCVWPASADPEQTVCRLAALQGRGPARLLEGPAAATPGPANHQEQQDGGHHPPLHLTPQAFPSQGPRWPPGQADPPVPRPAGK